MAQSNPLQKGTTTGSNPVLRSINTLMTFKEYIAEKNIDAPRHPGILKRQVKGKLTCSKARRLEGKGGLTAKAARRYQNYHCQ